MSLHFFAIPALEPTSAEEALNRLIVPTLQRGNAAPDAPASRSVTHPTGKTPKLPQ